MERKQLILIISSVIFVLAGTGAVLSGATVIGLEHCDWSLAADTENPAGKIGLNGTVTVWILVAAGLGILTLASGIVSLIFCKERWILWWDRVFGELQLLIGVLASSAYVACGFLIINWFYNSGAIAGLISRHSGIPKAEVAELMEHGSQQLFTPAWVALMLAAVLSVFILTVDLLVLQSFVRKIYARCFWRMTIIGRIVMKLIALAEQDKKLYRKAFLVVIIGVLLSMTWIGAAAVILAAIIYLPRYLDRFNAICEGTAEIKSGNLAHRIPVEGNGVLDSLAADINEISQAQQAAITKELKTQRMRTDLITNVSHDLKTPLTSLVTYVDLLKKEGLDSENAEEYLDILDEKTQRLQKLTADLFEAAKASSGDIPVHAERIDAEAIINQAVAEMEDLLNAKEIQTIVTNRAEDTFVEADGRHLWRIIENLLSNVSKYAMPTTRAYVDITDAGRFVRLEVKNMSADPLNIDPEELMERFCRGDASRSTEGSGLGLAIARDLTRLMGGTFDVVIDGDLFKATVDLPRAAQKASPDGGDQDAQDLE